MTISNITRTFLRTDETMNNYIQEMAKRHETGVDINPFTSWQKFLVKEFKNWVIVQNEFPYDRVADVNHMICTKRQVPFEWDLLTDEEKFEYEEIKNTYLKENYDAIWENLPKGQTKPTHFHLHLVVLKREIV